MKTLIVDLNNLAFATRFSKLSTPSSSRQKDKHADLMIFSSVLSYIMNTAKTNQCTDILVAGDSKKIWRKDIYPDYKAGSTSNEDIYYKETLRAADLVRKFFRDCTAAMAVEVPRCEADDIIGYWCHKAVGRSLILSTDKDYVQLLSDKVQLYSPVQKEFRTSDDPAYALFLKCIRGDKSDTIPSAYPRVRETVIRKAWESDYDLLNLVETVRADGKKVGEVLELNRQLMDLSAQPDWVKAEISDTIDNYQPSTYSEIKAIRFFGEVGLKQQASMVSGTERILRRTPTICGL